MNRSRSNSDQSHLVSPLVGGGINIPRVEQLMLLAYTQGNKSAEGMASFTWKILDSQNQKLLQEGKPLKTEKENIQQLQKIGHELLGVRMKILQNLMIIPKG